MMPFCTSCCHTVPSENLTVDVYGGVVCTSCVPPITPSGIDYELSYSNKKGLQLSAKIGTAKINIHIPQEEIAKVLK